MAFPVEYVTHNGAGAPLYGVRVDPLRLQDGREFGEHLERDRAPLAVLGLERLQADRAPV